MHGRETRGLNPKLKKTVVLVGMMGAGKSAVGRALASALNVPFRDSALYDAGHAHVLRNAGKKNKRAEA